MTAVFVCRGCTGRARLVERLCDEAEVEVRMVRCQKICHGPVIAVPIGGRLEWFERMSKRKRVAALVKVLRRGKRRVPGTLERVHLPKRSGRPPR